jgi:hypothetical protein
MRKLVLAIIACIAVVTFIRAFIDISDRPLAVSKGVTEFEFVETN